MHGGLCFLQSAGDAVRAGAGREAGGAAAGGDGGAAGQGAHGAGVAERGYGGRRRQGCSHRGHARGLRPLMELASACSIKGCGHARAQHRMHTMRNKRSTAGVRRGPARPQRLRQQPCSSSPQGAVKANRVARDGGFDTRLFMVLCLSATGFLLQVCLCLTDYSLDLHNAHGRRCACQKIPSCKFP